MADVITRLKIESGEYDSKIKRAVTGLQNMEQECRRVDGTLAILEKDQKQYIQSLGQMQTVSNTVRGKIGELTSAYVELSSQYKRLTDEEKKGDFGKALSSSLEQIKQRINDSKKELSDIQQELNATGRESNSTGSILDQLSQKFTINFDAVKLFNTALKAADGAMQVAKDAFFASEATVDEWGRTVAASESVYEGFLNALNNMDISGFLGRIDEIVTAARKAYDELDRLGTMKTIQSPAMSAQQTENERMRSILQTGRWIGAADGRQSSFGYKNGDIVSKEHLKIIEQQLKNGMNNMVTLVGREVKQTTKAIDAVYERQGAELGMSVKEFRKGTSSMAEFDKRVALAAKYNEYESQHTNTAYNPATGGWSPKRDNSKNPYAAYKGWDVFRVDGDRYKGLVQLIQQRDQQMSQMYGMQSQAYRTINRVEGTTVRSIMNGGSGGSTGGKGGGTTTTAATEKEVTIQQQIAKLEQEAYTASDERRAEIAKQVQELDKVLAKQKAIRDEVHGVVKEQQMATGISGLTPEMLASGQADIKKQMQSVELGSEEYNDLSQRLVDYNTVSNLLHEAVKSGLQVDDETREDFANALMPGGQLSQESIDGFVESLNYFKELAGDNPIVLDVKTGQIAKEAKNITNDVKAIQTAASVTADVVGSIGQAFNAIEDPAAKVMGTVMQSIATVALGYAEATAKAATLGPWAWIAFAATGLATMMTMVSSIHSATGYAEGGIIKGNSFSGDNIPADTFVNAGELVLNRAQQGALAQQLEGGRGSDISSTPYVTGEQIFLGLNNYLKGAGYGQLVTSNG